MRIERTKNATRNIIFGVLLRMYHTVVPFIMRTVMIYYLGVQYLGLNSLFASVLSVLKLAELGVGSAMVYSMYRPIAEDDTKTICALMKLYRKYYRIIGLAIALTGISLTPILPNIIHSNIPDDVNIYVLYYLHLATTVLSYWLFAYKNCLLSAHQRNDVANKLSLLIDTIMYISQIYILIDIKNYYIYTVASFLAQVLSNIVRALAVNKMYPNYRPAGNLSTKEVKEINNKVKDLFTSKIGGVILNSSDTIVISAFLGLTTLAIYQNYFYVMNSVINIILVVLSSCMAGIGNSLIVESKEKNLHDLNKLTFLLTWISGVCSSCLLCLFQPFMKIWVGDRLLLPFNAVICLCIYFYLYIINRLLNTFKDAGGIWHEDRLRPLITSFANICMNLIMVRFLGIYGVILSTVLSMLFIGMPWLIHNLFITMFNEKDMKKYVKSLILYMGISALACSITYIICTFIEIELWTTFVARGIVCCIVPNIIFFLFYRNMAIYKDCLELINQIKIRFFSVKKNPG